MPFSTTEGAVSSELDELVHGPAAALTAVALVAGPEARASGWAAGAAVALARRWTGPRRVVLADLGLDAPSLHEAAGLRNEEGVIDVVEYGVSLARVRQQWRDGSWDLVAAGAYTADAGAVLRSAAWSRVLVEVAQQRETLLALVPADADGADAVVRRAGAVLVLATAEEARHVVDALPHAYSVLAVLTPERAADGGAEPVVVAAAADDVLGRAPSTAGDDVPAEAPPLDEEPVVAAAAAAEVIDAGPAADLPQPEEPREPPRLTDEEFERIRLPTDRESREALIADLRERQRSARLTPPPDSELARARGRRPAGATDDRAEVLLPEGYGDVAREARLETAGDDVDASLDTMAPAPAPAAPKSGYRRTVWWTVALLLLLSLVAGSWRFLAGRLGWRMSSEPTVTAPPPAADAGTTPPAVDAGEVGEGAPLPWTVALEAHTDLAAAFRRLDALGQQPGMHFHLAPLRRDNTLYYHVMAGPVADSSAALALRDTLVARRLKTAQTPTDVRFTPLAFLVGDYGSEASAVDAITELRRLDMPAYMIESRAADGAPAYRVYVGGFGSEAEADTTRQLLRAIGVRDSLVTRTGSPTT